MGVQRAHDEVPRFGGGEGSAHRFHITQLTDDDDIGVLAQGAFDGGGEAVGIRTHLTLADDALAVGEEVLDGILNAHDGGFSHAGDVLGEGGERGGLA